MLAAIARHAHEPNVDRRDRLVALTFHQIQTEAEHVALHLPELEPAQRKAILDETLWEVLLELGFPEGTDDQAFVDAEVDIRFERRELAAREQAAPPRVRSKLIRRRLERRWLLRGR